MRDQSKTRRPAPATNDSPYVRCRMRWGPTLIEGCIRRGIAAEMLATPKFASLNFTVLGDAARVEAWREVTDAEVRQ